MKDSILSQKRRPAPCVSHSRAAADGRRCRLPSRSQSDTGPPTADTISRRTASRPGLLAPAMAASRASPLLDGALPCMYTWTARGLCNRLRRSSRPKVAGGRLAAVAAVRWAAAAAAVGTPQRQSEVRARSARHTARQVRKRLERRLRRKPQAASPRGCP